MPQTENTKIKLITLNIEGDNHLERVVPFLQKEQADVICLQEVFEKNIEQIKESVQMKGMYVPTLFIAKENDVRLTPQNKCGQLFITNQQLTNISAKYYVGTPATLPIFDEENANSGSRVVLIGEITKAATSYIIATTHFTWSPYGQSTPLQHETLSRLFSLLADQEDLILCGDFNAPRGNETWRKIAERYKDNIPPDIQTTVDGTLHRKGNIQFVVDGMFSTPGYAVTDVKVVSGVSDHMAIVGTITSTPERI